jgi:hypothetical protein
MQPKILLAFAVAAALVAACDRNAPQSRNQPSPSAGASQTQSTTSANLPKPTQSEKREGANPTQGQVDPKEPAQHRDFQQKGDARGPTSPDTTPGK